MTFGDAKMNSGTSFDALKGCHAGNILNSSKSVATSVLGLREMRDAPDVEINGFYSAAPTAADPESGAPPGIPCEVLKARGSTV